MFTSFEAELDIEAPRRLAISVVVAMAVLGALGFGAMVLSGRVAPEQEVEQQVDVSFRPPPPPPAPAKIENPPPPPPPKVAKAPPSPTPTPVVEAPAPAAAAMVAPKELPTKAAPEVAPDQAVAERHLAVGGSGTGAGVGNGAGDVESPEPVSAAAAAGGPINLPEDADPPEPSEDNVMPEYPEAERTVGHESVVILKIVIEADGRVGRIIVMKGDEPFLAAALTAVRSWHYEPAKLDGQTIATFKIVKIPFRLKT